MEHSRGRFGAEIYFVQKDFYCSWREYRVNHECMFDATIQRVKFKIRDRIERIKLKMDNNCISDCMM